jgi:hypothetical protein
MDKQEVTNLMSSSVNEDDWNKNCDIVKKAFNGQYPPFWYSAVIASGTLSKCREKWLKELIETSKEDSKNLKELHKQ